MSPVLSCGGAEAKLCPDAGRAAALEPRGVAVGDQERVGSLCLNGPFTVVLGA